MIVVASDVHLGVEQAERREFVGFLRYLRDNLEPEALVLNGDIEDLWRRDIRTVTREDWDVFALFDELQGEGMEVHYVLGNHDWYARHDANEGGPFYTTDYVEELALETEGTTYRFMHGHQFDPVQDERYFDLLARVTDDALGGGFDETWALYNAAEGAAEAVETALRQAYDQATGGRKKEALRNQVNAMDRCQNGCDAGPQLERAHRYAQGLEEDVLCVAHTHKPGITQDGAVANSGAWLEGEDAANTYLVLEEEPQLMDWNRGAPQPYAEGGV